MKCRSAAPDLPEDDMCKEVLISQLRSAFGQGINACGQEAFRVIRFSISVMALLASKYRDTHM